MRPRPAGRQTCSWWRWLAHCCCRTPRSILPGDARPAEAEGDTGVSVGCQGQSGEPVAKSAARCDMKDSRGLPSQLPDTQGPDGRREPTQAHQPCPRGPSSAATHTGPAALQPTQAQQGCNPHRPSRAATHTGPAGLQLTDRGEGHAWRQERHVNGVGVPPPIQQVGCMEPHDICRQRESRRRKNIVHLAAGMGTAGCGTEAESLWCHAVTLALSCRSLPEQSGQSGVAPKQPASDRPAASHRGRASPWQRWWCG